VHTRLRAGLLLGIDEPRLVAEMCQRRSGCEKKVLDEEQGNLLILMVPV